MQPTKPRSLLLFGIICAAAGWLIVRADFARLPALPWTGVPAMALLAIGEALSGRNLRARLGGLGKPVQPISAARAVALAKASSVVAAAVGGLAAGAAVYVAGSLDKPLPRADELACAGTLAAALGLTAAALYLERCCRTPDDPGDGGPPPGPDLEPPDYADLG